MINTIFGFGKVPDADVDAGKAYYVGDSQQQMYDIGFGFFITVILLIPIFLFTKPCCFREKKKINPRDALLELNGINNKSLEELEDD